MTAVKWPLKWLKKKPPEPKPEAKDRPQPLNEKSPMMRTGGY